MVDDMTTAAWKCPRCGITYKGGTECPKCLIPKPTTAACCERHNGTALCSDPEWSVCCENCPDRYRST